MKKLAIILASIAALVAIAWAVLTFVVIDREALTGQVRDTLARATGREVTVNGAADFTLFPTPRVTLPGIRISNIKGASSADFLSASQIILHIAPGSLFSSQPRIARAEVDGALIDLETLPGGAKTWRFSEGNGGGFKDYFQHVPLELHNGAVRYTNSASGATAEVTGLEGVVAYAADGASLSYKGKIGFAGGEAAVTATIGNVDLTQAQVPDIPVQFALDHGDQTIKAEGKIVSASQDPEFSGTLNIQLNSLAYAMSLAFPHVDRVALAQAERNGNVDAKGNVRIGVNGFELQNFSIMAKGEDPIPLLSGTVEMQYRFGAQPQVRFIPKLESVDLDYLTALYAKLTPASASVAEAPKAGPSTQTADEKQADAPFTWYGFLQKLGGGADITAENVIYNGRSVKFVHIRALLDKGRITLPEVKANLPGETWSVFSGEARLRDEGLEYNGKMEMQGRRMEEFLSLFAPREADIPDLELGMFGIRTNMAMTPAQFRLSELQARISNTRLAGALVLHREDRLRLESYLRMAGVNLDTINKAITYVTPRNSGISEVEAGQGREALFNTQYMNRRFDWLSSIGIQVDAGFLLEDFILFERHGSRAEFKLDMDVGKAALRNVDALYNGASFTGDYALLVQPGKNPHVEIKGTVSELDLADLFPSIQRAQNEQEWQKMLDETIDLQLLQTYTANIEAKIGKLTLRNYEFDTLDTLVTLKNNTLVVDKFVGRLWNGNINFRSVLQAGSIPSISTSLTLENADLTRFSQVTPLVKHAAGRVGIRSQVGTSGVSLRSWFNNASGAMSLVGNDISIQGFGLVSLARAVAVARTVSDLMDMKSSIMQNGVTRLNRVEGQLTIGAGQLDVTRLEFAATEARGTVSGAANLIDETLNVAVQFYLLSTVLPGETPPNMTLTLKGPIDRLEKNLDMQQVEAFVARKAAERMLNR